MTFNATFIFRIYWFSYACVSSQTFCSIQWSVCIFRHRHFHFLQTPVLLLRPLPSGSLSLYLLQSTPLQPKSLSSVSSCEHRALTAHLPLSCQVLWSLSFYANVAAAFWPRGDSLSLTALTADFTSNLLSLSSTAESCKCHYRFCHHHQLKHQLLPFLHLLFRANEVAADAQNSGFVCGIPKVVSLCRSVHVLKVSDRPGEGSSCTPTLQGWGADVSHKGWKRSPPPPPHGNFLSYAWCHSKKYNWKTYLRLRT